MASGIYLNRKSGWYKRRTKLEKQLSVVIGIVLVLFVGVVLYLAAVMSKATKLREERICVSTGCINAATNVLKTIDVSVDPCDDFYQFACGGFLKKIDIPEDRILINSYLTISDEVQEQIKTILDEKFKPTAPKQYHYIRQIYDMCMNTTAIEAEGITYVLKLFKSLGGWPILEGNNWKENEFDWKELLYKLRKIGNTMGCFVAFYVLPDMRNTTVYIIEVGEALVGFPREYLVKGTQDPLVKAYYDYMVDIAVLYGANRQDALRELKETLEFEIKVAHIKLSREESRNATKFYNRMTFKDLQDKYPFINWVDHVNNIVSLPNIKVSENEPVIVTNPDFLPKMDNLIRHTPKRVLANYALRTLALSKVSYLPEVFQRRAFAYNKIINGATQEPPRWKRCLGEAHSKVIYPVEATYVRKFFDNKSKEKVEEIVSDVREELRKILNQVDWMDDVTRKSALDKLDAMTIHVGYPQELLDDSNVEELYRKMEFSNDSYIKAMDEINLFYLKYHLGEIRNLINKTDWRLQASASSVIHFYLATTNAIRLPAGMLQGVFFDADRPQYMNYAAIGGIVGHEFTHGFDDIGRQYDKNGNLNDWWANSTKQEFIKKAKCMIDQYSNFTEPLSKLNLNGINTQGENIADNGAAIQSYLAYKSWVQRHGVEAKLPGVDFNQNQLFWITSAHAVCAKYRKESVKIQITTGVVPPAMFRVLGAFSNNEYFAKDFNCPLGSRMNPVKKCRVW